MMRIQIINRQPFRRDGETDGLAFARCEAAALKAFQLAHGPCDGRDILVNVELHNFIASDVARIRLGRGDFILQLVFILQSTQR